MPCGAGCALATPGRPSHPLPCTCGRTLFAGLGSKDRVSDSAVCGSSHNTHLAIATPKLRIGETAPRPPQAARNVLRCLLPARISCLQPPSLSTWVEVQTPPRSLGSQEFAAYFLCLPQLVQSSLQCPALRPASRSGACKRAPSGTQEAARRSSEQRLAATALARYAAQWLAHGGRSASDIRVPR